MNAERLHAVVKALHSEWSKKGTVDKLKEVITSLQSVVNQPHPTHQQTLANNIKALYVSLESTPSDNFSPAWRQVLLEIGGEDLFGAQLKSSIESIFVSNQITPAVAMTELQELHGKLSSFKNALDQCVAACHHFSIASEVLSPGEADIGILIPRAAVRSQLLAFKDELDEVAFILNTFSEVVTGKKDDLEIRTISSSDLLVHLKAAAPFAACVAVAVERVVALYKQLLEIRKLRNEISLQGVPNDRTAGIDEYANDMMKKGIDKIAVEIVDEYHKKDDKGRRNELKNAVRVSLNRIANRIDRGFNIEVRIGIPENGQQVEETDEAVEKATAAIQSASQNMQYLRLEGKPLLCLPESEDSEKGKKK